MENMFQHELSHCYGAYDRIDGNWWESQPSVMSWPYDGLLFNNWCPADYEIMNPRRGQFDGV